MSTEAEDGQSGSKSVLHILESDVARVLGVKELEPGRKCKANLDDSEGWAVAFRL